MQERQLDQVSWITMDESMNQVCLFWRYLIRCLAFHWKSVHNCERIMDVFGNIGMIMYRAGAQKRQGVKS